MKLSYAYPCEIRWGYTLFRICTILGGDRHRRGGMSMAARKKRLTLDLTPGFQRRLKVMAALKGISMRGYCQAAIDRELTRDEANGLGGLLSDKPDHELFAELQKEIFGDKTLPGNSADLIREAREIRDAEMERWG